MDVKSILPMEEPFTARLSTIALKPKRLFYYGKWPESDVRFLQTKPRFCFEKQGRPKTVAVVGARKYTEYGKEQAYKIAYGLAKRGVVIVSGLAYGIDSIAHRAALDAGGITIAVLGTPIDQIYPSSHLGLAREIVNRNGVVMSEYPKKDEVDKNEELAKILNSKTGRKTVFLKRNRLISGLSDVVIVVEADLCSGSLNTAHHAFEQSNLVYAVPGDIGRINSRGCNKLLGRGAVAYTDLTEILLDLGFSLKEKTMIDDTEDEVSDKALILKIVKQGVHDGDLIIQEIQKQEDGTFDVQRFSMAIFDLQMEDRVKGVGGNKWLIV